MTFQRGKSGNPAGRPKNAQTLTDLLRAKMFEPSPDGRPYREVVTETLMALAIAGNMDAIKQLLERIDGKVTTTVDLQGDQRMRMILTWGDSDGDGGP